MDKLQAIGREIRYVEYKLRRQQQEKKKKKQNRDGWMNSGGSSAVLDSGSAKFNEVKASEFNFNDDSSKFETDRPANKHEEDLQLELALAMSRDEQAKEDEPVVASPPAPAVVKPAATASLLDMSFDAPPQQQSTQQQSTTQANPWGAQPVSAPQWDPFTAAKSATPVQTTPVANSPWDSPATTSASPPQAAGSSSWQAFDDSFQPPVVQNNAPVQSSPPMQNLSVGALADPFGSPVPPQPTTVSTTVVPTSDTSQHLVLGGPADLLSDQNQNMPNNDIMKPKKTASDFLGGKGASLVNLDNLVSRPAIHGANPFSSGGGMKPNPFQKTSPGVPINQMSKPTNGFDSVGGGMVPLQPTNSNISPTQLNQGGQNYSSVFSSQPSNLLFGATPMSSGQKFNQQNKNPFS